MREVEAKGWAVAKEYKDNETERRGQAGCQLEYPRCFSGADTSISTEELWVECVLYASPNNDLWESSSVSRSGRDPASMLKFGLPVPIYCLEETSRHVKHWASADGRLVIQNSHLCVPVPELKTASNTACMLRRDTMSLSPGIASGRACQVDQDVGCVSID